jgi:two-component sensor histidine kinase
MSAPALAGASRLPEHQFPIFTTAEDASLLAKAIVDTVREPLLVLDSHLQIIVASRSFYSTFQLDRQGTEGLKIYDLDGAVWDIPELRLLLERIVPEHGLMDGYEVEREFPRIGRRAMTLNARQVFYKEQGHTTILLGIEDATERRSSERALQHLLDQKEVLLAEMSHRVANSLQIIASILLMKARAVDSEETRVHLQDAHRRVMSVASVQQHLQGSGKGGMIAVGPYLSKLCEALAGSMIADDRPISLQVVANHGATNSERAVSLGLVVTELVINALKHAFPDQTRAGHVIVGYEVNGSNWKLSISDDGVGLPDGAPVIRKGGGLGKSLVKALAQQLEAEVEVTSSQAGTTVSVTHAASASCLLTAA